MNTHLTFQDSTLKKLFNPDEFELFCEIIRHTASEYSEILGVLVTGSFVQRLQLPLPSGNASSNRSSEHAVYERIVSRTRRKFSTHPGSDLDIWVLTEDAPETANIWQTLDAKAIALVRWYAQHGEDDVMKWIMRKHEAFDAYYKKDDFYPATWVSSSPLPHLALGFRECIVDRIGNHLGDFRHRVMIHMQKPYPTKFLEVRAFPKALFNLRPEKIAVTPENLDRTPFAYYLKDWLDLEENCIVLYTKEGATELIYPFDTNGRVPGQALADAVGWKHTDIDLSLFRDVTGHFKGKRHTQD